jgi:hypothetical protein
MRPVPTADTVMNPVAEAADMIGQVSIPLVVALWIAALVVVTWGKGRNSDARISGHAAPDNAIEERPDDAGDRALLLKEEIAVDVGS